LTGICLQRPANVALVLTLGSAAHPEGALAEKWASSRASIPDVVCLCHDVLPGGGRIKARVKEKIGQLSSECFDGRLSAMLGFIKTSAREDGLNDLREGYKALFQHIDKPMRTMGDLVRRGGYVGEIVAARHA
jgi:hypothetical protein